MEVSKFNGQKLYTGLRLDYRLGLWAPTSASRAISAVAVLLVFSSDAVQKDTYSVMHYFIAFCFCFTFILEFQCKSLRVVNCCFIRIDGME